MNYHFSPLQVGCLYQRAIMIITYCKDLILSMPVIDYRKILMNRKVATGAKTKDKFEF